MKKIIVLLLAGLLTVSFTACSENENSSSEASTSSEVSATESSSEVGKIGELLMNSFGNLFTGSKYYIDVSMVSESYATESSKTPSVVKYSQKLAVDNDKQRAGLDLTTNESQKVNIVIKDNVGYEINHDKKTITTHTSGININDLSYAYTTYMWLGSTSGMTLTSSGMTKYDGVECDYERYLVAEDAMPGATTATITYYFKEGTPVAEVLESSIGKTTFTFNKVSDTIDESIFNVPSDYETISGDTSSKE